MKFEGKALGSTGLEVAKTAWYLGLFTAGVSFTIMLAAPFITGYVGGLIAAAAGIAIAGTAFYHLAKEHYDKASGHFKTFTKGLAQRSQKKQRSNTQERHSTYAIAPNADKKLQAIVDKKNAAELKAQKSAEKATERAERTGEDNGKITGREGLLDRLNKMVKGNVSPEKQEYNYTKDYKHDYQPEPAPALAEDADRAKREKITGLLKTIGSKVASGTKAATKAVTPKKKPVQTTGQKTYSVTNTPISVDPSILRRGREG